MMAALRAAGFPCVEAEGDVIHARLSSSGVAFAAEADGTGWRLWLCWPVRATSDQMAAFVAAHPGAEMDIWQGETRLSLHVSGPEGLPRWAALAEAAVVAMASWRRAQRAPGEGM